MFPHTSDSSRRRPRSAGCNTIFFTALALIILAGLLLISLFRYMVINL